MTEHNHVFFFNYETEIIFFICLCKTRYKKTLPLQALLRILPQLLRQIFFDIEQWFIALYAPQLP